MGYPLWSARRGHGGHAAANVSTGPKKFQAVIFDMDGVITDSEPLYAEALNEVLRGQGHAMSHQDHAAIMGSSIEYTLDWVISHFRLPGTLDTWRPLYDQEVIRLLSEKAEPTPGIYDLLDALKARRMKIGLASSSQGNWVQAVLKKLGVADRFQAIAACEMVAQAKPAPDLYLLAARKLGVSPASCVAIEDTPRGIAAGKAAGMRMVALRTGPTAGLDISSADYIIDSLPGFPLHWLD